jgi:hypothetical protein
MIGGKMSERIVIMKRRRISSYLERKKRKGKGKEAPEGEVMPRFPHTHTAFKPLKENTRER